MKQLVEVRFEPGSAVVFVQPGQTVLQAAEAAGVEITTGCCRGMCGTDPVRIAGDKDGLEPPAEHERGTIERMGLGADFRLSCSARLQKGVVRVHLDGFTG